MKNVFIVLLIAAIGGGVYYYFNHKQKTSLQNSKELTLGKWKIASFQLPEDDTISDLERTGISFDTSYSRYNYKFSTDDFVFKALDSAKIDTLFYTWVDDNKIRWSQIAKDTITSPLQILKLDKKTFHIQSWDGGKVFFEKVK